jgi:hypothetical protein
MLIEVRTNFGWSRCWLVQRWVEQRFSAALKLFYRGGFSR